MQNKFPLAKILILVTILAVPGFLYYLLQAKGKNRYKPLPIYGPKVLSGTFTKKHGEKIPDTTYHTVANLKAINQQTDTFTLAHVKKQLLIVNLFDSDINLTDSLMYKNLDWLYNEYKDNKMIRFASLSVNPADSGTVLKDFAAKHKAIAGKWDFLSSDTATTFNWANKQLFINAMQTSNGFVYSHQLVLLDSQHRLRGYYNASNAEEVKTMGDEIKVLIAEELRNIKAEF